MSSSNRVLEKIKKQVKNRWGSHLSGTTIYPE